MPHIVGIDPGLVTTGVFGWDIDVLHHRAFYDAQPIEGTQTEMLQQLKQLQVTLPYNTFIYVEKYDNRGSSYNTDPKMREFEVHLEKLLHNFQNVKFQLNMGSRGIVTPRLLSALQLPLKFSTTHHQDLEAACRIAIYGALKETRLNHLMYSMITDQQKGQPWSNHPSTSGSSPTGITLRA